MKLNFTNGEEEVIVKSGKEWYPILFLTPITFIIGGILAAVKRQFNISVVNMMIIFLATMFLTALVFSFDPIAQTNNYDSALVLQSKPTMITFGVLALLYLFSVIKLVMHVGDYHINALVKKGYYLTDMSPENIAVVEKAAKFKKPFWMLDN
jgi:hypothetical protein